MGKISWIKQWQLILVLLPGKFHRQRSLVGTTVHGVTQSWTWLRDCTHTHTHTHTHIHTHTHTPIQERVVESKKLQKSAEEVTVPLTTEVLVAMIQLYKNKQRTTCTTKQIMLKPQTRLGIVQSLSSLVYRCL